MWDKGFRFFLQKCLLSILAVCCLAPLLFLLWRSLGGGLGQYEDILLYQKAFYVWFWNSVIYTLGILLIHVPTSILAGFAFSHFRFPGKQALFFLYVVLMLLPFQATVVPQYLTLDTLGLLDTRLAMILPGAFGVFGTYLMTQFMQRIDPEILEAAKLDGAGWARTLWHVILPLCRPAIISLVVLQIFSTWSIVDQPLLFLKKDLLLPLSLELNSHVFLSSTYAAGVVYAVAPVLAYLYCQDALAQGIRLSSIK